MNTTKQRSTRSNSLFPLTTNPVAARPIALVTAGLFAAVTFCASGAFAQATPPAQPQAKTNGTWTMPTGTPPAQAPATNATASNATASNATASIAHPSTSPYPDPPLPVAPAAYENRADAPDKPESDEPEAPFFDLAVGTYVPLSVGGQATLELPGRLLLQVDLGWMPPAYGSAVNSLVQSVGGYDTGIGQIVDGALEDAVVGRVSVGWRPFQSAGFEVYGGYTHISLSGSVSPSSVAEVVGGDFASQVTSQILTSDIQVSSKLHNVHVALGWRWVAFDHLVLRATLGYTQTLGSSTSVESEDSPEAAALANPIIDAEAGKIYEEYVKLPVVGLSGGYRF